MCIHVRGTFSSPHFYTEPDGVLCDGLPQKKQINRLPVAPKEEIKGIKIKAVLGYHSNQPLKYSGSCSSVTRAGIET